jgi:multiple sugar transport system permease protein
MATGLRGTQALKRALTLVALLLAALVMLTPVYYMAVVANEPDQSNLSDVWFHGFHIWHNLKAAVGHNGYAHQLLNSLIVSGAIATLDVIIAAAAGYALATMRFPGRRALFATIVAILALSPVAVVVPVYVMMYRVHWLNSYRGLIIPGMASAFGVFLVRQFALGIPRTLIHAARLDRASELRIFVQIALPLLRPALLTLFLLDFLAQWDNLLWPLVVASDPHYWTVAVGLASFSGEHGTLYSLLAAAAIVSAIPPFLLFVLLQRYYLSGLTLGGLKG